VIEVAMTDQQNLDVVEVEAEAFDILLDRRNGALEIAIDENVSLGSGDQEGSQILAPDVINVGNDLVRREGRSPVGILLRKQSRATEAEQKGTEEHAGKYGTRLSLMPMASLIRS